MLSIPSPVSAEAPALQPPKSYADTHTHTHHTLLFPHDIKLKKTHEYTNSGEYSTLHAQNYPQTHIHTLVDVSKELFEACGISVEFSHLRLSGANLN